MRSRRTPKNYDGTQVTTHQMSTVLSDLLTTIGARQQERPDIILGAWPEIIGPVFAPMTQPISFQNGILMVRVKNSTLHSILSQYEKARILATFKQKFPGVRIHSIVFRIG